MVFFKIMIAYLTNFLCSVIKKSFLISWMIQWYKPALFQAEKKKYSVNTVLRTDIFTIIMNLFYTGLHLFSVYFKYFFLMHIASRNIRLIGI